MRLAGVLIAGLLCGTAGATEVTVAKTGGDFATVQAAVDSAPEGGITIRIRPGIYKEKIHIRQPHVHLIGMGKTPEETVLTFNDSAKSAGGTGKSGSVTVSGDDFEADNLTFENTWEKENVRTEEGAQAVALIMTGDRGLFRRDRFLGYQDTLYASSSRCKGDAATVPCQASRQLYKDCYIEGHVDFIFGDAKAVFENCEIHAMEHPEVMLTAQSRLTAEEDSGYYFFHTRVTGSGEKKDIWLGRPWRDYSTVYFLDTDFEVAIDPAGWREWAGRLKTSTYREWRSHGPGANLKEAGPERKMLTDAEAKALTPAKLLAGGDGWDPKR